MNDMSDDSETQVAEKIASYEAFVEDILKVDLQRVVTEIDGCASRITSYENLITEAKRYIEMSECTTSGKLKTKGLIDVGCEVYMQSEVEIKRGGFMYVDIGLGFYLGLHYDEVENVARLRINHATVHKEKLIEQEANIRTHIRLVTEGIRELVNMGKR